MAETTPSKETPPVPDLPNVATPPEKLQGEKELPGVVIEANDRHEAEKAQLKLLLALKDEQIAQTNLAHAAQARQRAKAHSDAVREKIEQKYGIDLTKYDISEKDGSLTTKRAAAIDPALLQQFLRQ